MYHVSWLPKRDADRQHLNDEPAAQNMRACLQISPLAKTIPGPPILQASEFLLLLWNPDLAFGVSMLRLRAACDIEGYSFLSMAGDLEVRVPSNVVAVLPTKAHSDASPLGAAVLLLWILICWIHRFLEATVCK